MAFLTGTKNRNEPDLCTTIDRRNFRLWFHGDEIIVHQEHLEGSPEVEPISRFYGPRTDWNLFTAIYVCGEDPKRLINKDGTNKPIEQVLELSWETRGAGTISESTLLNILANYMLEQARKEQYPDTAFA